MIEFLTYRGSINQELWTQPLVAVAHGRVAPIFGAAIFPNFGRLIDRWMQQLQFDMSRRGSAFEQYVRDELANIIHKSALSTYAKVLPESLQLRPSGERPEEIDLVFVIGPVVYIGEAKCALLPTEPKEEAMHRRAVIGAIEQIKRKMHAAEKHRALLREQLKTHNIVIEEPFQIFPLVILNSAMHAGFHVDGVTIVDENILRIFFEGSLVDFALASKDGNVETLQKRVFYTTPVEAFSAGPKYFAAPPQLDTFTREMAERVVPVPAMTEGDWVGLMKTFECILRTSALPAMNAANPS